MARRNAPSWQWFLIGAFAALVGAGALWSGRWLEGSLLVVAGIAGIALGWSRRSSLRAAATA